MITLLVEAFTVVVLGTLLIIFVPATCHAIDNVLSRAGE